MISIEERASQFDFIAYPTYDTLPLIYARIRALLDTGRRATLIRYYRAADPHLELHPSLTPDWHGGPLPSYLPSELVEDSDARTRYFEIGFWPGLEQLRLRGDDGPEEAVAERFIFNQPSTRVEFNGLGQGSDDYVQFTTWNQHGVCLVTRLQLENRTRIIGEIPDDERSEDDNEFVSLPELLESMTTPERESSFLMMSAHMLDSLITKAHNQLAETTSAKHTAKNNSAATESFAARASTVTAIATELDKLADENPAIRGKIHGALALCIQLISSGDDTVPENGGTLAGLLAQLADRGEGIEPNAGPHLRLVDGSD